MAESMRRRSSGLTDSGLLSVREMEAVETPTCFATSRIPTDFGFMMKQFTANDTSHRPRFLTRFSREIPYERRR
jgi:hypothetical protein